ncbi:MAG: hypothetical protein RL095_1975 [Verrucomicrobiota bacterium]|jgi:predicted exporter
MPRLRRLLSLLLLLHLIAVGWASLRLLQKGVCIDTDLHALLPVAERDPALNQAGRLFQERFGRRSVVLISSSADPGPAALAFATVLRRDPAFDEVRLGAAREEAEAFGRAAFDARAGLLEPELRRDLEELDAAARLSEHVGAALLDPARPLASRLADKDPFCTFAGWMMSRQALLGGMILKDGLPRLRDESGREWIFISLAAKESPFSSSGRTAQLAALRRAQAAAAALDSSSQVLSAGGAEFAAENEARARRETAVIGGGSLLGIVLLAWLVFRGFRPLAVSLLVISYGCFSSFVLAAAWLGQLHAISLAVGVSLIGVADDFVQHWVAARRCGDEPREALERRLLPPLSLGLCTSLAAYLGLLLAPFPGLRQIALLGALGLLGAFLAAPILCPLLVPHQPAGAPRPLAWGRRAARWTSRASGPALLAALACCLGLFALRQDHDLRHLNAPSPELAAVEAKIRRTAGTPEAGRFVLIRGADLEECLQREEALELRLRPLQEKELIHSWIGLASVLPSRMRQERDRRLLLRTAQDPHLVAALVDLGFATEAVAAAAKDSAAAAFLTPERLGEIGARGLINPFVALEADGEAASFVLLRGVQPEALPLLAAACQGEGCRYTDLVAENSELLRRQTHGCLLALGGAALLMLFVFAGLYGWRQGLRLVGIPGLSAAAALGACAWLGQPLNFFGALSLSLVLGLGVNYSLATAAEEPECPATALAVFLSSLSTLLAFGLLALSQTPALRSFGLPLAFGILFAWLLSPWAGKRRI